MTDAEIIKALECHTGVYKGAGCMHCGFTTYGCDCLKQLNEASLDLINRQKADYEHLKNEHRETLTKQIELCDVISSQKAEIERLTINMNAFGLGMKREKERADTASAEAIKEFAERLKESKHECGCNYRKKPVYAVTEDKIDNLVKEMAGETE